MGGENIHSLIDTLCFGYWGPKGPRKSAKVSVSLKIYYFSAYTQKALKETKRVRTEAPKTQCLVTPRVLQCTHLQVVLKKQHSKKSTEEAAKYTKLLAKERRSKKNSRNRLPRDAGCPHREVLSGWSQHSGRPRRPRGTPPCGEGVSRLRVMTQTLGAGGEAGQSRGVANSFSE